MSDMPAKNGDLIVWAVLFREEHGRAPRLSEATAEAQIELGKYVIALSLWAEENEKEYTPELIHFAMSNDYGFTHDVCWTCTHYPAKLNPNLTEQQRSKPCFQCRATGKCTPPNWSCNGWDGEEHQGIMYSETPSE